MLRVSSLDAGMLHAETPEMPMHTMGVLILGRTRHSVFGRLERGLAERLHLLPVLRRRLAEDPLAIDDEYWIEDPDFALENHLIHAALPAPHGMRELADYAGELAGRLLDRSRPLWEMHLLDGLAGGGAALVVKVHHAAMDGGKLVELMNTLLDPSARMRPAPAPGKPWLPEPAPSQLWFAADRALTLVERPLRVTRSLAEIGATLLRGALAHREEPAAAPEHEGERARLFEAPVTPFNGSLSPARALAMADVRFATVKAISTAFGTTVNDVVLAAGCGALRTWLVAHGALPERPLVANVPVTVRGQGSDEGNAGNRVSMILVHLPVQTVDPVERLRAINAETTRAKAQHGGGGGKGTGDVFRQSADLLTNIAPPWVWSQLMSGYAHSGIAERLPLLWNLVISNLPGPRATLYCGGARVLRVYPFGPVQLGTGLNLTVLSSGDRLCLGAMACKRMMPDVEQVATGFVKEIGMLRRRAVRTRGAGSRAR